MFERMPGDWTAQLDPVRVADCYRLPHVIDYGAARDGDGLLITTGAGLLLSDMDALPTCRWAVDIGASRGHEHAAAWAVVCSRLVSHTVAHLWMAITDPAWMAGVLAAFPADRLAVCARPHLPYGYAAGDVDELAAWCRKISTCAGESPGEGGLPGAYDPRAATRNRRPGC